MKWNRFWIREDGKQYDEERRRRAGQKAALYYLVAFYIGYMGFSIMKNRFAGDTTMSYPLAVILASVLLLGAIWVAWYAMKQMKNEYRQSEIKITGNEEGKI
jgi:cytochrome bd-type quinol oxidase subunit 2